MAGWYAFALVAFALTFVIALGRQRSTIFSGWDRSSSAVFAVAWLLNVEHTVGALTHGVTTRLDPIHTEWDVSYSQIPARAHQVGLVATACLAIVMIAQALSLRRRPNLAGLLWMLVLATGLLSALRAGLAVHWTSVAGVLVIAALGVVLRGGQGARLGAAMFGASLIPVAALLLVLSRHAVTLRCTLKCTPLNVLFTGPFSNENAFGLTLAIVLPFMLLAFQGSLRIIAVSNLAIMVTATGSRTAMLSMSITFAVFLGLALARRRMPARTNTLAGVSAGLASVAAIGLPLARASVGSSEFTGRANYWGIALSHLRHNWLLGLGTDAWQELKSITTLTNGVTYSPHNQWLEVLVAGGAVAGLFFAGALVALYCTADDRVAVGLILVSVMSAGFLEAPWSTAHPDWLYWSVLATIVAASGPSATERSHSAANLHATGRLRGRPPPLVLPVRIENESR